MNKLISGLNSGHIIRYHTARGIFRNQTVGEHRERLMQIFIYIAGDRKFYSRDLIMYLLLHDSEELKTGDIPYTAKRRCEALEKVCSIASDSHMRNMGINLSNISNEEVRLVKWADMLEMYDYIDSMYIIKEYRPMVYECERWFDEQPDKFPNHRCEEFIDYVKSKR